MSTKYTIKPLNWYPGGWNGQVTWWLAYAFCGYYIVEQHNDTWIWGYKSHDSNRNEFDDECESLEDGQQRAFKDWTSRISQYLEVVEE